MNGALPRVLVVVGTRPEAIKMLPLVRALHASDRFEPVLVATGQHRAPVEAVFDLAGIAPDIDLDVLRPGSTLTDLTARVLTGLQPILDPLGGDGADGGPLDRIHDRLMLRLPATVWDELHDGELRQPPPDELRAVLAGEVVGMLVQGDTTSAVAAALAAYYHRIPVGHVEAGLRTDDVWHPYPEEMNRRLIGNLATVHFAPTPACRAHLLREGVPFDRVIVTGNTVIDALRWASALPVQWSAPALADLDRDPRRVLVVTAHRRENWGEGIAGIAEAVARVARAHPADLRVVLSLHPNPRVREQFVPVLGALPNVALVEPLGYSEMAHLLQRATIVLTDSGGLQEEAPAFGVPVLVTRTTTERPEAVRAGVARLVGTDTDRIVAEVERLLGDAGAYDAMARAANPYGDGRAAERIVAALASVVYGDPPPAEFGSALDQRSVLEAAGYPHSHRESTPRADRVATTG